MSRRKISRSAIALQQPPAARWFLAELHEKLWSTGLLWHAVTRPSSCLAMQHGDANAYFLGSPRRCANDGPEL
jgi:hypothetical protein